MSVVVKTRVELGTDEEATLLLGVELCPGESGKLCVDDDIPSTVPEHFQYSSF